MIRLNQIKKRGGKSMNLNIFQLFTPKDRKFFPLFEKSSANLVEAAKVLVKLSKSTSAEERREFIIQIENYEHIGDSLTHEIFHELSANFITPFDREDIHSLTSAIDDVVDFIHGASKKMDLYKMNKNTNSIVRLSELILLSAEQVNAAVIALRDKKHIVRIKENLVKINSIENEADDVFDTEIAKLFETEKDAIELIKMKDILSSLETATDKCEDAANVIESIVVKNA